MNTLKKRCNYMKISQKNFNFCSRFIKTMNVNESISICDKMLAIYERLCASNPSVYNPQFAQSLWILGETYYDVSCKEMADKLLLKAFALYKELDKENHGRYMSCLNAISRYVNQNIQE